MYCSQCGALNSDQATRCSQCQALLHPPPFRGNHPHVPNYLTPAILTTLFCCLPFGIVAIVYAAQVNGKLQAGDLKGAWSDSTKAKNWCLVSFGCGLLVAFLYLSAIVSKFGRHF